MSACGMRTYSAWVPSMVIAEDPAAVRQCEYIPFLQKSHLPQAVMQEIRTWSPRWKLVTACPHLLDDADALVTEDRARR